MNRWFRVYEDMLSDPKVQRLPPPLFKALVNLWCLASKGDGILPPIEDIAFTLHLDDEAAYNVLDELKKRGLLDEDEDGITPHNWTERQFKSDVSTDRVKRFRKRSKKRNTTVSPTVSETFHETVSTVSDAVSSSPPFFPSSSSSPTPPIITTPLTSPPDSEADSECADAHKTRARDDRILDQPSQVAEWPSDYREQFEAAYPHKVGMAVGLKALDEAKQSGKVTFAVVMGGVAAYANKSDDRHWANPRTWIVEERWNDQPAPPPNKQQANGRNGYGSLGEQADRLAEEVRARELEIDSCRAIEAERGDQPGGSNVEILPPIRNRR